MDARSPCTALILIAALLAACPQADAEERLAPAVAQSLTLSVVASGLGPTTDLAFLPDGRMVIIAKDGTVRLRAPGGALRVLARFPVDEESEKGLLGVAVDPEFARTRRLFFYYSLADGSGGTDADRHRVVSLVLSPSDTLELGAQRVLVRGLRGPANHDGGALAIGPDGKLYIGVGDTGCNSGEPPEPPRPPSNYFGTCLSNGNGKILRVNLDGSIPADNPLTQVQSASACGATCRVAPTLGPPRADIWAWGFRNPWRFGFDPQTGRLWVGDVGEISYEEITIARAGRHHGWPYREGPHGFPTDKCRETRPDTGPCVDPVYHCRHGEAAGGVDGGCQSITGGTFLHGPRWPAALRGRYVFADNVHGRLWTLAPSAARDGVVAGSRQDLGRVAGLPVSLRSGPEGDLYIAVLPGRVLRISPRGP